MLAEREMEITTEQLAELQRITKTKGETEEDKDDHDRCVVRIRRIVQADGVRALVKLSEGASEATKEQIALGLRQIAIEPSVRGSIIQQGGYRACIEMAMSPASSTKCTRDSAWCLARSLVTTNPGVLTASQRMSCIAPLLRLCCDHRALSLAHFEALLALTNIASFAEDTKARIASENGIRTLEYLQFSDHELVRRAATECLCNMMPNAAMIEHLRNKEKMKLWCAFAEDFESDALTARAALGTLAMAAGIADEDLQKTLLESKACEVFVGSLSLGPEMAHRAAVGLCYLSDNSAAKVKLAELGALKLLSKTAKKKSPDWAQAAAAASDAHRALSNSQLSSECPAPPIPLADSQSQRD